MDDERHVKLTLTLDKDLVYAIDLWQKEQFPKDSRLQALERLIRIGLEKARNHYTEADMVAFELMVKDCKRKGMIEEQKNLETGLEGVRLGFDWALDMVLQPKFTPDPASAVAIVMETLEMWGAIESAYEQFGFEEKRYIDTHTEGEIALLRQGKFIRERAIRFKGFSASSEAELVKIATFLIETAGRYPRFRGRELAHPSEAPTQRYDSKRAELFKKIRAEKPNSPLTAFDIRAIALAGPTPWEEVKAILNQQVAVGLIAQPWKFQV